MATDPTVDDQKVAKGARLFVPYSEDLLARIGSPSIELVPFHIEYHCVRLLDNGDEECTSREFRQGEAEVELALP